MNRKQELQKLIDENHTEAEEGESAWELFAQQQRNLIEFSLTF